MPVIRIEYDDNAINKPSIKELAVAVQKIVSEETDIKEVMVYVNSSQIKIAVDPIEIFVEMSKNKILDRSDLISRVKSRIKVWKSDNRFTTPINLTITPMDWNLEIGI